MSPISDNYNTPPNPTVWCRLQIIKRPYCGRVEGANDDAKEVREDGEEAEFKHSGDKEESDQFGGLHAGDLISC